LGPHGIAGAFGGLLGGEGAHGKGRVLLTGRSVNYEKPFCSRQAIVAVMQFVIR